MFGVQMGGYGSGRKASQELKTIESLSSLDVREVFKLGLFERGAAGIEFQNVIQGHRVKQRISLEFTPCNFGKSRPWFICPRCGRRVAILYRETTFFACRKCWNLPYFSQRANKAENVIERIQSIRAKLGWHEEDLYMKPPRMHGKTFRRLIFKLEDLERQYLEFLKSDYETCLK